MKKLLLAVLVMVLFTIGNTWGEEVRMNVGEAAFVADPGQS